MARVELSAAAVSDLDRLIRTHTLPRDTKGRVRQCLVPLRRFPEVGPQLTGRWRPFRFVFGPWRWMLLVYVFLQDEERVVVVTIQDARSSISATTSGTAAARRSRNLRGRNR